VHLGSALNEEELGALKAAARQRLVDGQGEFDLGLGVAAAGSPLEITASRAAHLWDAGRHGTATAHRDMMRPQPGIGRAAPTAANPPGHGTTDKIASLLIWGGKDTMIPASHTDNVRREVPNIRVEIFPNAGHFPQLDEPELFFRVLDEFLRSEPPAPENCASAGSRNVPWV